MSHPPMDSYDRPWRPGGELSKPEADAILALNMAESRYQTVLSLIDDTVVIEAVQNTCAARESAFRRYLREHLARLLPASAPDIHRTFDRIDAERRTR